MTSNGTIVDAQYFKTAGIETGTVPIIHASLVRFLEDDFDALDDAL
jgi:hypothetical protein